MLFNQDFLKHLVVLYVEDDETIRLPLIAIFKKLFGKILVAKDGVDGLQTYINENPKTPINVVISDINMPNMNGIEMLKEIRKINENIPFIFTTAYTDSKFLLDAINLGVAYYAVKPINIKELTLHLQHICFTRHDIEKLHKTQKSNDTYMQIINQVAIVSKTDIHGDITFINDIFCDVTGYSRKELIGANHRIIRHPEVSKEFFDTLWNSLRSGKIWHGKIKNMSKSGDTYYIDANIFPIYDAEHSMDGWMSVSFLITETELEKQKFYRNVLSNIKTHKETEMDLRKKLIDIQTKQQISDNVDLIQDKLALEQKKRQTLALQLKTKEDSISELEEKIECLISNGNNKARGLAIQIKQDKEIKQHLQSQINMLKNDLDKSIKNSKHLTEDNLVLTKRINELIDVTNHLENKLKYN